MDTSQVVQERCRLAGIQCQAECSDSRPHPPGEKREMR